MINEGTSIVRITIALLSKWQASPQHAHLTRHVLPFSRRPSRRYIARSSPDTSFECHYPTAIKDCEALSSLHGTTCVCTPRIECSVVAKGRLRAIMERINGMMPKEEWLTLQFHRWINFFHIATSSTAHLLATGKFRLDDLFGLPDHARP